MVQSATSGLFGTIVWATDGSARSDDAYGYVRGLCEHFSGSLRIVHVAYPLTAGDDRQIAKLKAMTSSLRRRGVNASLHVVRGAVGSPAPHIAEVARMTGAGLVIMTTRGRSKLNETVAGSVTQRLLTEAPCPVLVLRQPIPCSPRPDRSGAGPGIAQRSSGAWSRAQAR
jgi:nucleotide-binding universal stress UspA family protein